MIRSIIVGLGALAIACCLPVLVLEPAAQVEQTDLLLLVEEVYPEQEEMLLININGTVTEIALEEYVKGVVLSEMPISFHDEALKAQAVASRTFAMRQMGSGKHEGFDVCSDSGCCQAWNSMERLEEKFGETWDQYEKRAENAVQSTKGYYLSYDGELVDAVYFSCSGGRTEAAVAVWGSEVPYLQSVDSPGEEGVSRYHSEKRFSTAEVRQILSDPDLAGDPGQWFGASSRSEGGGVAEIQIGNTVYSGTDIRKRFNLDSTLFTVNVVDGEIVFDVLGYGHRVGMSQYGANAMAQEGQDWRQILSHYYPHTEIKKQQANSLLQNVAFD